ncbi:unnamed protein product, partial [marine sediment metagenome]
MASTRKIKIKVEKPAANAITFSEKNRIIIKKTAIIKR